MLDDEEHVLVVQQPYEVKAAEAAGGPECQIADHHRAVEAPLEQKLSGGMHEARLAPVLLQRVIDHVLQPARPLLERVLLLQGGLEVVLEPLHHRRIALADPGGLLLHVGL